MTEFQPNEIGEHMERRKNIIFDREYTMDHIVRKVEMGKNTAFNTRWYG